MYMYDLGPYDLDKSEITHRFCCSVLHAGHSDKDITVRVVGQERDGTLLYTWDDYAPVGVSYVQVTHIGLYDPAEQKNEVNFLLLGSFYCLLLNVQSFEHTVCN